MVAISRENLDNELLNKLSELGITYKKIEEVKSKPQVIENLIRVF